jgi:hypothetical protein
MLNGNMYYTTKGIYGVKLYTYIDIDIDIDKECTVLFTQQSDILMSNDVMEDVKAFLCTMDEKSKQNVKVKAYRKCKSIENENYCMVWCDISLSNFITEMSV